MSYHKTLRTTLGFTQEAFASYLGITRSLLSMVELGERELPTSALLKLADVELHLQHMEEMPSHPERLEHYLKREIKECGFHIRQLSERLDTMKKQFLACKTGLQFLTYLKTTQELTSTLKLEELRLKSAIDSLGPMAQAKLQLRLAAWKGKLDWLKAFKNSL